MADEGLFLLRFKELTLEEDEQCYGMLSISDGKGEHIDTWQCGSVAKTHRDIRSTDSNFTITWQQTAGAPSSGKGTVFFDVSVSSHGLVLLICFFH